MRVLKRAAARRFGVLWTATAVGYVAGEITKLLFPLLAVDLTRSPLLVSVVVFAASAPWLLVSLPAGALVDRLDRRAILFGVNAARVVIVGGLALLWAADVVTLPLVALAAFAFGISETFIEPTTTAITPMVVERDGLERANTRLVGVQMAVEVLATPLGGALAAVGLAVGLAGGGAGFALACATLLLLRGSYRPARTARRHLGWEIADGVRFLWRQPALRAIALMAAVINGCWTAWAAAFVLFAVEPGPMGLSTFAYGLVLTGGGLGGVLGTLLAGTVDRRLGRRWSIGVNIIGNAIGFGAAALTTNAWLIGFAVLIGGVGGPMWGIAATSLQQRAVPDELRGRVSAVYRFIGFGALALGALLGGLLGELLGLRAVFFITTALTLVTLIPFARVVTESGMRDGG
jgi:MFS family permease